MIMPGLPQSQPLFGLPRFMSFERVRDNRRKGNALPGTSGFRFGKVKALSIFRQGVSDLKSITDDVDISPP